MKYQHLTDNQKQALCTKVWNMLTKQAGSNMITIAWSRMSVEEAITKCTDGEIIHLPATDEFTIPVENYNRIYRLVEYFPGAEEYDVDDEKYEVDDDY